MHHHMTGSQSAFDVRAELSRSRKKRTPIPTIKAGSAFDKPILSVPLEWPGAAQPNDHVRIQEQSPNLPGEVLRRKMLPAYVCYGFCASLLETKIVMSAFPARATSPANDRMPCTYDGCGSEARIAPLSAW
jgi:hypothetical protein